MDVISVFAKMSSGDMTAHSELGTRDESKQVRSFGNRIQKMKTVTGLNARLLAMKDVVIPFNPFTGEDDEVYNSKTPFRPILLVSQVIEGLAATCKTKPEVAEVWKREIGIDLSGDYDINAVYLELKKRKYIRPRVMTYHTVAMNFGGIMGFPEFRVKYTVDSSQLNADGSYDYGQSAPWWHQGAIFFNSMLKPEADATRRQLESQGASKEQLASAKTNIYKKSPVGFVGPSNIIPFFYFPFGSEVKQLKPDDFRGVEECMRHFSYTDKWTVPISEAMSNPMYDTNIDFFDFHVRTPSSKEQKPSGGVYTDEDSMEVYTAMQIGNIDGRLAINGGITQMPDGSTKKNDELYASFITAVKAYFMDSQEHSAAGDSETFEAIMAKSSRFRPIDTVLDSFLPACNEVFLNQFASSPYFTEEVKRANANFFTAMNPANAMALADADEDELKEAAESQASSVKELISDAAPKAESDGTGSIEEIDFSTIELAEG